jgi:hypothetical protein
MTVKPSRGTAETAAQVPFYDHVWPSSTLNFLNPAEISQEGAAAQSDPAMDV